MLSLSYRFDRAGYEGDQDEGDEDEDPRNATRKARNRIIKSAEANLLHVCVTLSLEDKSTYGITDYDSNVSPGEGLISHERSDDGWQKIARCQCRRGRCLHG